MSIVVTCDCTMEYRLPDRYAGKRCRCRECGGRIQVPRSKRAKTSNEDKRRSKKRKKRAKVAAQAEVGAGAKAETQTKKRKARRARPRSTNNTTRRLGAQQDREIEGERRNLHSSQNRHKRRAVSESMHQLAPMRSGDRLSRHVGLVQSPSTGKARRAKGKAKKARVRASERLTERLDRDVAKGRAAKKKKTKGKSAERGRETAKLGRAKGKAKLKRPTRGVARRGRGKTKRRQDEDGTPTGRKGSKSPTTHALYAVVAIVGVLCLGIGLVVGGAFTGKTAPETSGLAKKFADIQTMKSGRNWTHAKTAVDLLEVELKAAADQDALEKLYTTRAGIDKMVQILALESDETRLTALVDFSTDEDPTVRAGIVWELRGICEQEDAQRAILNLTTDPVKAVATAARQAMVQAGGPLSIPFLEEAIVSTAGTGGKQGDVALSRAVEIDDPAIVPVLLKILEVRSKAPASALRQVLNRLAELGTPECVPAIKPFLTHADAEVAEVAKDVIAELGG